jgi:hypothetical protein
MLKQKIFCIQLEHIWHKKMKSELKIEDEVKPLILCFG